MDPALAIKFLLSVNIAQHVVSMNADTNVKGNDNDDDELLFLLEQKRNRTHRLGSSYNIETISLCY